MSEVAINLIKLRPGRSVEEFSRFSVEVDQPVCLAQDVVEGFDAFAVTRRDPRAPSVDIVEVMQVRSWDEWVRVRDDLAELEPVNAAFDRLVPPDGSSTVFARPIRKET